MVCEGIGGGWLTHWGTSGDLAGRWLMGCYWAWGGLRLTMKVARSIGCYLNTWYISWMKSKRVSITEYAEGRGVTRQAILKQIKYGRALPGIKSYEKIGETWMLTVKEIKKPLSGGLHLH